MSIRSVLHVLPLGLLFATPALAQVVPAPTPPATIEPATPLPAQPSSESSRASGAGFNAGPELTSVLAQSGGLTAADAARRAADESVEAASRREQVVAAQASRQRVLWQAAPRLTLTGRTVLLSEVENPTFPGFTVPEPLRHSHTLNASLVLPLSDYLLRTVKALRGASINEDAAVLEERAARVTASSNAKLGYYDWARARLQGVLAAQALTQASAQLARTRALFDVGRAAEADLLQGQAFEAEAQLAVSQSETQLAIAEERLRVAISAGPDEALSIGEDVLAAYGAADEAKSADELYREALGARLELQALGKSRAALEDLSSIESTRAFPVLEAIGNLTYANPNTRVFPLLDTWNATWDVGLQAVWTVNDLGTASAQARTVSSQAAQLEQQEIGLQRALRVEVVGALRGLEQARLNVSTAEHGERAAAAAYSARARLQEQGMGTTLELLQAETVRTQARLNVVNAHIALRVARVQLDHAVGRDVPAAPSARR